MCCGVYGGEMCSVGVMKEWAMVKALVLKDFNVECAFNETKTTG